MRLGFLASHRGSNMQSIIDACKEGKINAEPVIIISNNANSGALERGRVAGMKALHISPKSAGGEEQSDRAICEALKAERVDLVILAGYMRKIGNAVLSEFSNKIINIHPALLPKYGGQGMYGEHVHSAVLKAGESETGVTIHLVNEEYDRGRILAQEKVPVEKDDTVETLAKRVLACEHKLYAATVARIASGELVLGN